MPRKTSDGVKGVLIRLPTQDLPDLDKLTLAICNERLTFFTSVIEEVLFATQTFRPYFRSDGILTLCRENRIAQTVSGALGLRGVRSLPNKETVLGWIPLSIDQRRVLDSSALRMGWSSSRFAIEAIYTFLQLCGQRTPLTEIPLFFLLKCADSLSRELICGVDAEEVKSESHLDRWLRETNTFLKLGPRLPAPTNLPRPPEQPMTSEIKLWSAP